MFFLSFGVRMFVRTAIYSCLLVTAAAWPSWDWPTVDVSDLAQHVEEAKNTIASGAVQLTKTASDALSAVGEKAEQFEISAANAIDTGTGIIRNEVKPFVSERVEKILDSPDVKEALNRAEDQFWATMHENPIAEPFAKGRDLFRNGVVAVLSIDFTDTKEYVKSKIEKFSKTKYGEIAVEAVKTKYGCFICERINATIDTVIVNTADRLSMSQDTRRVAVQFSISTLCSAATCGTLSSVCSVLASEMANIIYDETPDQPCRSFCPKQ